MLPIISFCLPFLFVLTEASFSQALSRTLNPSNDSPPTTICIVGSGIGGSSAAHFLRRHSPSTLGRIRMFEGHGIVGGRMSTVTVGGDNFEAGASILHPKNLHALNLSKLLNLRKKKPSSSPFSLGIWDGNEFIFKTLNPQTSGPIFEKIVSLANSIRVLWRYGFSLLRMHNFVESAVDNFLSYYKSFELRPVFETVDEMLQWSGLYNLTRRTLQEELTDAGLSPLLIQELVTVITRINYGQSACISGLAGAVSLAGSGGGLWSIEGGNWQIAAGLINISNVDLHLSEAIESIANLGDHYELNSTKGNSYVCDATVIATPLDELNIHFVPPISIPERKLQHTHATFIRGLLNHEYFGLDVASEIPELVGTVEVPDLPFTSISVLKQHNEKDSTYKIFSRKPLSENLLDDLFRVRNETVHIDWGAYPHYHAPEAFAPFILDGRHLYYINAFENAASTIETGVVAAENVARLVLSRQSRQGNCELKSPVNDAEGLHLDL